MTSRKHTILERKTFQTFTPGPLHQVWNAGIKPHAASGLAAVSIIF